MWSISIRGLKSYILNMKNKKQKLLKFEKSIIYLTKKKTSIPWVCLHKSILLKHQT